MHGTALSTALLAGPLPCTAPDSTTVLCPPPLPRPPCTALHNPALPCSPLSHTPLPCTPPALPCPACMCRVGLSEGECKPDRTQVLPGSGDEGLSGHVRVRVPATGRFRRPCMPYHCLKVASSPGLTSKPPYFVMSCSAHALLRFPAHFTFLSPGLRSGRQPTP